MALKFHPDKNTAPGADEAFKSKLEYNTFCFIDNNLRLYVYGYVIYPLKISRFVLSLLLLTLLNELAHFGSFHSILSHSFIYLFIY